MASPDKHALLSASGAKKWLAWPQAARIEQLIDDESTVFAEEGTAAHSLAELKLTYETGKITKTTYTRRLNKFKKTNEYYSPSMEEYVDGYVTEVLEIIGSYDIEAKSETVFEQHIDFSEWVPEGFGTSDVVILAEPTLHIVDLKFGKGIKVDANHNPQLMLYALGALYNYSLAYDFDTLKMTIMQPRLYAQSTYEISRNDLLKWADNYVKPRAQIAWHELQNPLPVEDIYRICNQILNQRTDANLKAIAPLDDPHALNAEKLANLLEQADEIKKWIKDIQDYALAQVRDNGAQLPGFKLVAGRSTRKLTEPDKVAETLISAGFDEVYKPQELKTLTALEKMVGPKRFNELLSELIIKPAGNPALVPDSDKRPEINSVADAIADFEEE